METQNDRINKIMKHPLFLVFCDKNDTCETDRVFCRHNLAHFLDVARIAYILSLEKGLPYQKDVVYGAALLHDIGKWQQYQEGIPHNTASAALTPGILTDCGYTPDEIQAMVDAIRAHRKKGPSDNSLSDLLYQADKKSRPCFACPVSRACNWENCKKNNKLQY